MILDIPFEKKEKVYIIINRPYYYKEWCPPDYSLGGDVDGPFDRGHYTTNVKYKLEIKETVFTFSLLDEYNINEIYKNKEDAEWALLLKLNKNETIGEHG